MIHIFMDVTPYVITQSTRETTSSRIRFYYIGDYSSYESKPRTKILDLASNPSAEVIHQSKKDSWVGALQPNPRFTPASPNTPTDLTYSHDRNLAYRLDPVHLTVEPRTSSNQHTFPPYQQA